MSLATTPRRELASRDWPLWSTVARIVVDDPTLLDDATAIADLVIGEVDAAASRFRSDSELSRIAPHLPAGVDVSPALARLICRALDAAETTDGAVDPTLGYAMDALGYDRDIRLIEKDGVLTRAVVSVRPGWRSVRLVGGHLTVPAHLALDLGATAKAVTADLVAERVARELDCAVLISLGGDIATAGPAPESGWTVLVQDLPRDPAGRVSLRSGHGMATSSTQKRVWQRDGRVMHHILDPRTGLPAEAFWRSVTVAASSCLEANTLSTAAIVRGRDAVSWLRARHADARLVGSDGTVTTLGGWPSEHPKAV